MIVIFLNKFFECLDTHIILQMKTNSVFVSHTYVKLCFAIPLPKKCMYLCVISKFSVISNSMIRISIF